MKIHIDFKPVEKELASCKRCFDRMKASSNFSDYEDAWCDFLNRLEKVFEKLNRICAPQQGKFSSLICKENLLRRTDPLLKYLKQARNADTHSIQETTELTPASYGLGSELCADESGLYIEKFVMEEDKVTEYKGSAPLLLHYSPEKIEVKQVMNQGQVYSPPTSHLGKKLDSKHPTKLAKLGLDFYCDLFDKVKDKFA